MNIVDLARKLLDEIDVMTELLYQNKEKEGYALLDPILGELQNLITVVASYQQENGCIIMDQEKMLASVGEAFQAMQDKDQVLFADIFCYIIKEQLEQLVQE